MTVAANSRAPPTVSLRSTAAIRLPSAHDPGENSDGDSRGHGPSLPAGSNFRALVRSGACQTSASPSGSLSCSADAPTVERWARARRSTIIAAADCAGSPDGAQYPGSAADVRLPDAAAARCAPWTAEPVPDAGVLAVRDLPIEVPNGARLRTGVFGVAGRRPAHPAGVPAARHRWGRPGADAARHPAGGAPVGRPGDVRPTGRRADRRGPGTRRRRRTGGAALREQLAGDGAAGHGDAAWSALGRPPACQLDHRRRRSAELHRAWQLIVGSGGRMRSR